MFRFLFVIILLIFSLFSVKLLALEVNDLYQVTVAVNSQAREQREQAITKALRGVFLKIGGKKSVLQHELLLAAQQKPSRYLNQYRYQRKEGALSLVVSFNENKVNALFKQADLALWGSLRPQVLLWLIDEQGTHRKIVTYDGDINIIDNINDFSTRRGLPIVMPLMDLTDIEQVQLSDFWGYFPEQVQHASSRYFADAVVVMRVSDSSLVSDAAQSVAGSAADNISCGLLCQHHEVTQTKVLDWKIYIQGVFYTQQYQGVDKVSLITQGLSDITEVIYQSYALSATAENNFVIQVNNVTSLKADTKVFDFLMELSAVKAVTLISAQGDVRHYKLELIGSKNSLLASLKLNNKLTQKSQFQLDSIFESIAFKTDVSANAGDGQGNTIFTASEGMPGSSADNSERDIDVIEAEVLSENIDLETIANEPVTPSIEEKEPLLVVPSVPVFYWEQG
ncbi:MAG: DUF2066 domain-containing protein [Colwellia sp.]